MPTTMKLIAKNVLGSAAANVEFTAIPQTFDDLLLVASARGNTGDVKTQRLRFNGDTASNYSGRYLQGDGAAATSGPDSATHMFLGYAPSADQTASTFSSCEVLIPNYTGSTQKSVSVSSASENNATTAYLIANAGLWTGTAAITTILFYLNGANMVSGSSVYLYGIKKS